MVGAWGWQWFPLKKFNSRYWYRAGINNRWGAVIRATMPYEILCASAYYGLTGRSWFAKDRLEEIFGREPLKEYRRDQTYNKLILKQTFSFLIAFYYFIEAASFTILFPFRVLANLINTVRGKHTAWDALDAVLCDLTFLSLRTIIAGAMLVSSPFFFGGVILQGLNNFRRSLFPKAYTPSGFQAACKDGKTETIENFLSLKEFDPDAQAKDNLGNDEGVPLKFVIDSKKLSAGEKLNFLESILRKEANLSVLKERGCSLLFSLLLSVDSDLDNIFELVKVLLMNGTDPNVRSDGGTPAVRYARQPKLMQYFLENGAFLNLPFSHSKVYFNALDWRIYMMPEVGCSSKTAYTNIVNAWRVAFAYGVNPYLGSPLEELLWKGDRYFRITHLVTGKDEYLLRASSAMFNDFMDYTQGICLTFPMLTDYDNLISNHNEEKKMEARQHQQKVYQHYFEENTILIAPKLHFRPFDTTEDITNETPGFENVTIYTFDDLRRLIEGNQHTNHQLINLYFAVAHYIFANLEKANICEPMHPLFDMLDQKLRAMIASTPYETKDDKGIVQKDDNGCSIYKCPEPLNFDTMVQLRLRCINFKKQTREYWRLKQKFPSINMSDEVIAKGLEYLKRFDEMLEFCLCERTIIRSSLKGAIAFTLLGKGKSTVLGKDFTQKVEEDLVKRDEQVNEKEDEQPHRKITQKDVSDSDAWELLQSTHEVKVNSFTFTM